MKAITEITSSQQTANVIRLAPYCRVSSDSEDQLHSFAAQIQYYTEYAQRNPQYQLVDIYADEGITGTSMEKRDDFHRLMRDCKKGLIDRIIVKSVSRFARNTEELLATLRMLSEIGVSVYFEENAIDTAMMNSEMIVTFPGMSAQQESISSTGSSASPISLRCPLTQTKWEMTYAGSTWKLHMPLKRAVSTKKIYEKRC